MKVRAPPCSMSSLPNSCVLDDESGSGDSIPYTPLISQGLYSVPGSPRSSLFLGALPSILSSFAHAVTVSDILGSGQQLLQATLIFAPSHSRSTILVDAELNATSVSLQDRRVPSGGNRSNNRITQPLLELLFRLRSGHSVTCNPFYWVNKWCSQWKRSCDLPLRKPNFWCPLLHLFILL